ncbi:hypothetical protein GQ473_05865 [archaeon]|nr:hypothetical protein [archaeon]
MVYGIKDLLQKVKEVKNNITAKPLGEYVQKNVGDIGTEPYSEISKVAGVSNCGDLHVSHDVSIEDGARTQGGKILVSKDALDKVYGGLKYLAIQERTKEIAKEKYDAVRERVESSEAFKNIDGANNNMLSQGKINMQRNYAITKKNIANKRAELTTYKSNLLEAIENAATDLELQQFDKEHTATQAQKIFKHTQKKPNPGMFILFICLGISSIAALQHIESANSFNATGYFLTSASLVSTNVIFVLFVFITGFLLGKHQK